VVFVQEATDEAQTTLGLHCAVSAHLLEGSDVFHLFLMEKCDEGPVTPRSTEKKWISKLEQKSWTKRKQRLRGP
jgi:hypothetical protein